MLGDNPRKRGLIPDSHVLPHGGVWKGLSGLAWDGLAAYQLVGGVMAYQGDDG